MIHFNQQRLVIQERKKREEEKRHEAELLLRIREERIKSKHSDGGLRLKSRTRRNIDLHKKHRQNVLEQHEQNLIICPKCGDKGVQLVKFVKSKGSSYTYMKHLTGIQELDDGRVKRKTKLCLIGRVATDDWDIPETAEGFKAVMSDLLMVLKAIVTLHYAKSPTSTIRSHKAAADLQNIINQYERYIVSNKKVHDYDFSVKSKKGKTLDSFGKINERDDQ
jgi:hypothetical protein